MSDSYAPAAPLATPINIPLERSLYVGNVIRGILYGLEIFTFFAAVYCISHRPPDYRKRQRFYMIYGGILLTLVTIDVALDCLWGEYMWIDHRNYPGGPPDFYVASEFTWYSVMQRTTSTVENILGNGLLLYRCFIIWDSQWYFIALPVLIYLASSALSIITLVEYAIPGTSMFSGESIRLTVPWVSLSVSLNIIVTSMICFRVLRMRTIVREVLSPEMSRTYTSIVAILIESAAPFSILGIGLVVTAALELPLFLAFTYVWTMFCSLSPQMIILRVAIGRAWLKETVNDVNTELVFAEPAPFHEQSQGVWVTGFTPEGPVSVPGTPVSRSSTSVRTHMSATGYISC